MDAGYAVDSDDGVTASGSELETLLKFTADDLDANRARRMSEAQLALIRDKVGMTVMGFRFMAVLMFLVAAGIAIVKAISGFDAVLLIVLAIFGVVGVVLLVSASRANANVQKESSDPRVEQIRGRIAVVMTQSRSRNRQGRRVTGSASFRLEIGDEKFSIDRELYQYLEDTDGEFTVYYSALSRQILSMESH